MNVYEVMGYAGLALTVIGQVVIGVDYMLGQGCWLMANGFYLVKGVKQEAGRAEVVRNVTMFALTLGLMIAKALSVF